MEVPRPCGVSEERRHEQQREFHNKLCSFSIAHLIHSNAQGFRVGLGPALRRSEGWTSPEPLDTI